MNRPAPISCPGKVAIGIAKVVVDVIFVADVEWGIRKSQVHRAGFQPGKSLDAVLLIKLAFHRQIPDM
jgi:hypothetical protein